MRISFENPEVVLLKKKKTTYQHISGGTCEDIGKFPIDSQGTCTTAASVLGLIGASVAKTGPKDQQGCRLPGGWGLICTTRAESCKALQSVIVTQTTTTKRPEPVACAKPEQNRRPSACC